MSPALVPDETMRMNVTETNTTPLPLRNDTILGICEAIGEDFGFNPLWLRLAFVAPLFAAPMLTIAAYLALGVVVAASRYLVPRRTVAIEAPAEPMVTAGRAEPVEQRMPIAA